MLKKRIEYVDNDGEKVIDECYFNMSSVDMTRFVAKYSDYTNLELDDEDATQRALSQYLTNLIKTRNMVKIVDFLEDLILTSYGTRPDGKHFVKTKANREEFSYSLAYAALFEELLSDQNKMQKFISGVADGSNTIASDAPKVKVLD